MKGIFFLRYFFLLVLLFFDKVFFSQNGLFQNSGFEQTAAGVYTTANAVNGWTVSSQTVTTCSVNTVWNPGSPEFSVMTTPFYDPYIGIIGNNLFGGNKVVRLNNSTANNMSTKIAQSVSVTSTQNIFYFGFAGYYQNGGHNCCEQPRPDVLIKNCLGNTLLATPVVLGVGCISVGVTFTSSGGGGWCNWQYLEVDLSPFIGSCVTVEFVTSDCIYNSHIGFTYFDVINFNPFLNIYPQGGNGNNVINFCPGTYSLNLPWTSLAAANFLYPFNSPNPYFQNFIWLAPSGYSLSANQATNMPLTVTNPTSGMVFTLSLNGNLGYGNQITYTLQSSNIGLGAIASSSSCMNGSSGSASVIPNISGINYYNYVWTNSLSVIVGTNSIVNNLSAGVYSVQYYSPGNLSCGLATSTVLVGGSPPQVTPTLQVFCPNQSAFLFSNGGSNFQWYSGTLAIPANQGGTASSYTVAANSTTNTYYLGYNASQNCRDSIKYILYPTNPGTMGISNILSACSNSYVGQAVINLTPAPFSLSGFNTYSVISGSGTPLYSITTNYTSTNIYTVTGMPIGNFSVSVFDGSCFYNSTFTVNDVTYNYTLVPNTSTVCQGMNLPVGVSFGNATVSPGQYTYSWSPNSFITGGSNSGQNIVVTPTVATGTSSVFIYSVTVMPTIALCPITKTLSFSAANPVTPTISNVPILCKNSSSFSVSANPPNGIFSYSGSAFPSPVNSLGVINTSLAPVGQNTITYSNMLYTCSATDTKTFFVDGINLSFVGSSTICQKQPVIMVASGANNYLWSNGSTNSFVIATPMSSTIYTVSGTTTLNNCNTSSTVQVNVLNSPTLSILGNTDVCTGGTTSLYGNGASIYTWNQSFVNNNIIVSPTTTTRYFLSGAATNNCSDTTSVLVAVHYNPTLAVTGNTNVCSGRNIILTANGAANYLWNGAASGSVLTVAISMDTLFILKGISKYGCESNLGIPVTALNSPTLNVTGNFMVCKGYSTLIGFKGADSVFINGLYYRSRLEFIPDKDQVLQFIGRNNNTCTDTQNYQLRILPLPKIFISGEMNLCKGQKTFLKAHGATEYFWNTGSAEDSINISPKENTKYYLRGTDIYGCDGYTDTTVVVEYCVNYKDSIPGGGIFSLYPNPAHEKVLLITSEPIKIKMYSMLGEKLNEFHFEVGRNEIDLGLYSNAAYCLQWSTNSEKGIYKLIKN